jgi:hypothetical protein
LERHKAFDLIVYLAIMLFFSKHLSAAQMASPARMHSFCSNHAGLLVLFMYAFQHGGPICAWWAATRSNR